MKRVLVCVLDWGLGHATRSIPVIRELLRQGSEVHLASSGTAGSLLKLEFPALPYHELPGYRPRYSRNGLTMSSMLAQLPKFYQVVRNEHKTTEDIVQMFQLHAVVSDNRYGCYSDTVPSVLITHQERLRLMPGFGFLEGLVNGWLQNYYENFDEVWNPDQPGSGLTDRFISGKIPVRHIGWLSRFPTGAAPTGNLQIMAVVSGPEPQRSLFEQRLRAELRNRPERSLLVTGRPDKSDNSMDGNLEVVNHLNAEQMEARLRSADLVIARSGYSTVMDLIALGKRAAFVPTPLQPEQLFLAEHLMNSGIAFCQDQKNFDIQTILQRSGLYAGFGSWKKSSGLLESAINQLL